MTLAVAALYPWGRWAVVAEMAAKAVGSILPQAVLFACDSRWTILGPQKQYLDIGAKLFRLAADAGAVYAGDAQVAEEALGRVQSRLEEHRPEDEGRYPEIAGAICRSAYQRHRAQRPSIGTCHLLIGACTKEGRAELWYLGCDNDFRPEVKGGVPALGWSATVDMFRQAHDAKVAADTARSSGWSLNAGQAAIQLAAALNDHIIVPQVNKYVGGKVQCGLVDRDGFRQLDVSWAYVPKDGNVIQDRDWEKITAANGELTTYHEVMDVLRKTIGSDPLALHQVVN